MWTRWILCLAVVGQTLCLKKSYTPGVLPATYTSPAFSWTLDNLNYGGKGGQTTAGDAELEAVVLDSAAAQLGSSWISGLDSAQALTGDLGSSAWILDSGNTGGIDTSTWNLISDLNLARETLDASGWTLGSDLDLANVLISEAQDELGSSPWVTGSGVAQGGLDTSPWILGSDLGVANEALGPELGAGLDTLAWTSLGSGQALADLAQVSGAQDFDIFRYGLPEVQLEKPVYASPEVQAALDSIEWSNQGIGQETSLNVEDSLSGGKKKFDFFKFKRPGSDNWFVSGGSAGKFSKFGLPEIETIVEEAASEVELPTLDFPKFQLPNIETVVVTEEEVPEMKLPKFELPKIEKGPVKEVPVYVYQLPPWPAQPKLELPKLEPVKEVPLVLYEMAPLPEIKPLPLPKLPEIRIEKYLLPPPPKLELPKLEPLKEIPIVMYEFPTPELKLPKVEPIKEIPIIMYELPEMPKIKPLNLPKIKMPQIKIIKKKLPPLPALKLPKLDLKLPEVKVVKYQMPETKPFELPKMPEIKFVKYEMPPPEKAKLPEFKLPEIKPIELPEIKPIQLPEIKPIELPKVPQFKFPEMHPMMMMPPVQYMYAPIAVPMPYAHPLPLGYAGGKLKQGFGGYKSGFGNFAETGVSGGQPIVLNSDSVLDASIHGGAISENELVGSGIQALHHHGGYAGHGPHVFGTGAHPSSVILMTGNDAVVHGNEDVTQFFLSEGNGLTLESTPWSHHHSGFVQNPTWDWLREMYGGGVAVAEKDQATAGASLNVEGNLSVVKDL